MTFAEQARFSELERRVAALEVALKVRPQAGVDATESVDTPEPPTERVKRAYTRRIAA